jgi:hypothetical protein
LFSASSIQANTSTMSMHGSLSPSVEIRLCYSHFEHDLSALETNIRQKHVQRSRHGHLRRLGLGCGKSPRWLGRSFRSIHYEQIELRSCESQNTVREKAVCLPVKQLFPTPPDANNQLCKPRNALKLHIPAPRTTTWSSRLIN